MSEADEEKESSRPHLPVVRPDLVDAEFRPDLVDAEFNEPDFIELPKTVLSTPPQPNAFYAAVRVTAWGVFGLGVLYFLFGWHDSAVTVTPPLPSVPGWDALAECPSSHP